MKWQIFHSTDAAAVASAVHDHESLLTCVARAII